MESRLVETGSCVWRHQCQGTNQRYRSERGSSPRWRLQQNLHSPSIGQDKTWRNACPTSYLAARVSARRAKTTREVHLSAVCHVYDQESHGPCSDKEEECQEIVTVCRRCSGCRRLWLDKVQRVQESWNKANLSALERRSRNMRKVVKAICTIEKLAKEGPRPRRNQCALSVSPIGHPMTKSWSHNALNSRLYSATERKSFFDKLEIVL